MRVLEKIRYKLRYNAWPRLVVNVLKRLGIILLPYYLFRRSLGTPVHPVDRGDWELIELCEEDMPQLASLPLVHGNEQTYRQRIRNGQRALALRRGREFGAFCWLDPEYCSYAGEGFRLPDDEIYSYDIYTVPALRGMNLAPLLNALYSERLRQEGYRSVCSVVDVWNKPSLNYVRKIGAVAHRKNLYISIFGVFRRSFVMRRFQA